MQTELFNARRDIIFVLPAGEGARIYGARDKPNRTENKRLIRNQKAEFV